MATKIEWTDKTWNPIVGCSIVSPGCTNCYAMKLANRLLNKVGSHYAGTTEKVNGNTIWTGRIALAPAHIIEAPLTWKRPSRIFVNSMGDLFHEDVPEEWLDRMFAIMALCPQHTFQVLTKRPDLMRRYMTGIDNIGRGRLDGTPWRSSFIEAMACDIHRETTGEDAGFELRVRLPLPNVILMTSTENQYWADKRIPELLATPAAWRGISAEPLLGDLDLFPYLWDLDDWSTEQRETYPFNFSGTQLDWIICGGESGRGFRQMNPAWPQSIRDQCAAAGVPFFSSNGEGTRQRRAAGFWMVKNGMSSLRSVRVYTQPHRTASKDSAYETDSTRLPGVRRGYAPC